jgi:hypothetical protein
VIVAATVAATGLVFTAGAMVGAWLMRRTNDAGYENSLLRAVCTDLEAVRHETAEHVIRAGQQKRDAAYWRNVARRQAEELAGHWRKPIPVQPAGPAHQRTRRYQRWLTGYGRTA